MECTVSWTGATGARSAMGFVAETGSGHVLVMDGAPDTAKPENGGQNLAPRPMETVLAGTGGCTAYDVVLILKRGRQAVGGCQVKVKVDDNAAKSMAASRPKTDEAIAMFIEDERALWRLAKEAKVLTVEFPVKAGGTRTAVFEVGGLEPAKLPKWN